MPPMIRCGDTRLLAVSCVLVLCFLIADSMPPNYNDPRTCSEAGFCCGAQNNTCLAKGPRIDGNYNETYCYCDANCLIMRDCCRDYTETCRSTDCEVSDWSAWEGCDNPCGLGTRKRVRKVAVFPENGGKTCPVLKERRACQGDLKDEDCQQQSVEFHGLELSETGRILPSEYGFFRQSKEYNPWKGILKNLYKDHNEIYLRTTYCAEFEVTHWHPHYCGKEAADGEKWGLKLEKGSRVCVECQPTAMHRHLGTRCRGHGVFNHKTHWKAVGVEHCSGEWKMVTQHTKCTCNQDNKSNFIFI